VLGGGANSRLFYEVRERRALVYAIYSFLDFFRDTGVLGVYYACNPRKLKETLQVVLGELHRLTQRPVSAQELGDLKEQMRGNLLLSLENSSNHMWRMVQHELYLQSHPTMRAPLAGIDRLSAEDVQRLARDLFLNGPMSLAVVGPVGTRHLPPLDLLGVKNKISSKAR
jgi:predicted Zn-dependent peptidase